MLLIGIIITDCLCNQIIINESLCLVWMPRVGRSSLVSSLSSIFYTGGDISTSYDSYSKYVYLMTVKQNKTRMDTGN